MKRRPPKARCRHKMIRAHVPVEPGMRAGPIPAEIRCCDCGAIVGKGTATLHNDVPADLLTVYLEPKK
jgi:hypothetical protein